MILSNGAETIRLVAGKSLTVTPSPGSTASVALTAAVSGVSLTPATFSVSTSFGPFSANVELIVAAIGVADVDTSSLLTVGQAAAVAAAASSRPIIYPMRKLQRGFANVRANLSNMTIACLGDSETAGNYANGSSIWTANKAKSYPTALAAVLQGFGVNTCNDSVTSDNSAIGHAGTVAGFDTKVANGANWGSAGGANTAGGQWIQNTAGSLGSAGAETLTFTPAAAFDTVEVYWYRSGTVGTMTVDNGGAVLSTLSTTGGSGGTTTPGTTNNVNKTVITGFANGVVNIIRTVLGTTIIVGIVAYLSTKKTANILNMGWSGARCSTTYWTGTTGAYNPLATLSLYAPDLSIIMLGANDAFDGTSTAAFAAQMTVLANQALTTGDVLLCTPLPIDPTATNATPLANQAAIVAAYQQVGAALGLNVLDLNARWVSYTVSNALGYYYTDKEHPVQIGYQDVANAIGSVLMAA